MKSLPIALCLSALALGGCQTMAAEQHVVFKRVDGRTIRGNARLEQQFNVDITICKGDAQRVAAGAAPIYAQGIVGIVSAETVAGQRRNALIDVVRGCMAERGYVQN